MTAGDGVDYPSLQQGASELFMLKEKRQLWLPSSPSPHLHYKVFVYRCVLFFSCKPINQGQRREAGSVITSTLVASLQKQNPQ